MVIMQVGCHAQTHQIWFDDLATAQAELDKLRAVMGRDRWGSNGKGEEPTHIIKSPAGDVVVVIEKVELAKIHDTDIEATLSEVERDKELGRKIACAIRYERAMTEAGFGAKSKT